MINSTGGVILAVFGILVVISWALVFPLIVIWALNLLFGLAIPHSLLSYLAVSVLLMAIGGGIRYTGKKGG